jgi:D-alanyl-D-alanine carboxypeptidase (penicillin-binding protein 5/6)
MGRSNKFFFWLGIVLVLGSFSFWQRQLLRQTVSALKGQRLLLSPLSSVKETAQILGEITTISSEGDLGEVGEEKEILAQAAYTYDLSWGKLILEKNAFTRLPAASTVKIVTAAVALDRGKLNEEMTVNYFPTLVGESSMNLGFGEKFSLEELLYGLLVTSGNDAAETIAQGLAGKREIFVSWMNEYGQKLGAENTRFTTPSGLDEEGQYTTAYDLFLMGREIFNHYPKILEISATKEKYLPRTAGHKAYLLRNKLLLLDDFAFLGVKPGLGEQGKMSLVALMKVKERRFLVVLIRTDSLRHDLTRILEKI